MNVTIEVMHWKGDHRCEPEDAAAILIDRILFNDEEIPHSSAEMPWSGPGSSKFGTYDFMSIVLHDIPEDVFSDLSLDDIGLGSTAKDCIILVSGLEIKQAVAVA